MESMILTPRLQLASEMIPRGAKLADVGTDHGKLPISLLKSHKILFAVASDIHQGPLLHAKRNAVEHQVQQFISFRLCAGLDKIMPNECDTISILGMGGEMIASILESAAWSREGKHLLVMQAMTMQPYLRRYLSQSGFSILDERICRENNRFYTVIVSRGGEKSMPLSEEESYFSAPLLSDPLAKDYLSVQLKRQQAALSGMKAGLSVNRTQQQQKIVDRLCRIMEELL